MRKWCDYTPAQKVWMVIAGIDGIISCVFCILNLTGQWPNQVYLYMLSAFSLIYGVISWQHSIKTALLHFAIALIFLLSVFK